MRVSLRNFVARTRRLAVSLHRSGRVIGRAVCVGFVVFTGLVTTVPLTAQTVAFTPPGSPTPDGAPNFPVNAGLVFTAKTNFFVDALGFYYGSGVTGSAIVGLYNSSGTLLTSTTVLLSDPIVDGYLFHSITPVALTAGQQYTVVEFTGNNDWSYGATTPNYASNFVTYSHSDYQYGGNGGCLGAPGGSGCLPASGLSFTTQTLIIGGTVGAYYGPNFEIAATQTTPQILSQFVFGGGWYSALYFTNSSAGAVSFPVSFTSDNGTPLTVPSVGGSSTTVNLAPQGTAIVEAPNVGTLSEGYVIATLPAGVTGYGVFRQSVPGVPDQEAVVPLASVSSASSTLTYDDTDYVTGVAIANPSALPVTVAITVWNSSGSVIGTSSIFLAAGTKTEAALRNITGLSGVAGNLGSAQFTVALGSVAVLGLRFNGTAFTSIPTVQQ